MKHCAGKQAIQNALLLPGNQILKCSCGLSFILTLSPGHRLLLLCQMPPASKNKVCPPQPVLRFLLYFNQVTGKILEKVYGLLLMFPNDKINMRPLSLFCDL